MHTATDNARAMLDMLKTHHADAADAGTNRELLGYALADMCQLAEGLGLCWDDMCATAAVDARYIRSLTGPVDTTAFAIAAE